MHQHQTVTGRFPDGTWGVLCRCEWESRGFLRQVEAIAAGEDHVSKEN